MLFTTNHCSFLVHLPTPSGHFSFRSFPVRFPTFSPYAAQPTAQASPEPAIFPNKLYPLLFILRFSLFLFSTRLSHSLSPPPVPATSKVSIYSLLLVLHTAKDYSPILVHRPPLITALHHFRKFCPSFLLHTSPSALCPCRLTKPH